MGNNFSKISKEYDARYIDGKIYTITCEDGAVYVGSTIQILKARFSKHKTDETCSMYKYIHNNYDDDWSNCKMELYENYPCNNENELKKKEGEIIRLIGTINEIMVGRTQKEYYEENKIKIAEKHKEWYNNNIKTILEQKKEYYKDKKGIILEKIICDCGCISIIKNLKRHQKSQRHQHLMNKQITAILSFLKCF